MEGRRFTVERCHPLCDMNAIISSKVVARFRKKIDSGRSKWLRGACTYERKSWQEPRADAGLRSTARKSFAKKTGDLLAEAGECSTGLG